MDVQNPFEVFYNLFATAWNAVVENAFNYLFGILAIVVWVRFVLSLLQGRFSVLLLVLGLIFSAMAATLGQDFWNGVPFLSFMGK